MSSPLRIGLFGIGLDAYWPQFSGLKERLEGYIELVASRLAAPEIDVVNLGLIDTAEHAYAAGREFRRQDVDMIVLHVTTYALSSTVLPVVLRARVPVLVLSLVPGAAIDYAAFNALPDRASMTGEWLAHCSPCTMPEIANVFRRAGVRFQQITGRLDVDSVFWGELAEWVAAAKVAAKLHGSRVGLMGHYYSGMLDIYSDVTLLCATFGTHVEIIEVDELSALRREMPKHNVTEKLRELREAFEVQPDCPEEDLWEAARTAAALERLVAHHRLNALAYYYKGSGVAENEATLASIIPGTSLLTAKGIPVAGEYEVKNIQAMKILDLFGAGGSFTEYYALDFNEDVVLMGHDGPGHIAIAAGRTKLRPLNVYHGKVGRGLSVEMAVKQGPVTLLSILETTGGRFGLLYAEAESVAGPILQIGNTNSRYRFPCGARDFLTRWNSHGPAHHCAVGIGHLGSRIEKLGAMLGIEVIRVC